MSDGAMVAASSAASGGAASSYRVKFDRENFLELVRTARPRIIYRRKNMYFFSFDGFVMYCDQCEAHDFSERILDAIEFSNYDWQK
jgi:hypothetical protein